MAKAKKGLNLKVVVLSITAIFLISWAAAAIASVAYSRVKVENSRLKGKAAFLEEALDAVRRDYARLHSSKITSRPDETERRMLDFVEWQFVVREQVVDANERLKDAITQIKDLEKNKRLVNLLYYNLGLNYMSADKSEFAIMCFEEALRFDSKDADSHYNLGLLYSAYRGDARKAVENYKRYLALAPKSPRAAGVADRIKALEK